MLQEEAAHSVHPGTQAQRGTLIPLRTHSPSELSDGCVFTFCSGIPQRQVTILSLHVDWVPLHTSHWVLGPGVHEVQAQPQGQ